MSHNPKAKQSLKEGFEKFVIRNPGKCWGWKGCAPKNPGYGQFRSAMKLERAHRASWTLHFGEIPKGIFVLHKCDNRICSNPQHLFLGNHLSNTKDMMEKGRHPTMGKSGEDNHKAVLTNNKVREIKRLLKTALLSACDIAEMFNVRSYVIYQIKTNKTWRVVN